MDKFLQVTASYNDGHRNGKSETGTTSAVQAGTNRAPTFTDGLETIREVAEDTGDGGNVGPVVGATDLDSDSLVYSLTGTDATSFTVDNSGQIKVGASTTLNYESAKKSYTVIARVHDSKDANGGTDTTIDDTIVVTIDVTNLNEDGTVSLSMTQPSVRVQLTASLTDPDSGVIGESWQWTKADTKDGNCTGITIGTTATYSPVDGDVGKFLCATVSYEDAHGANQTAEAVSENAVQAGANRAPTFDAAAVTREVAENTEANIDVGSPVTATDQDTGTTLSYTLEGTDKDSFKMVSGGQIQTESDVTYDFETKASYSVTVKANDGNGGTATKAVTINLTNVDEAGTVTLSTNQPSARAQVTATLDDPDGSVTVTTWQWAKSDNGNSGWTNVGTNSDSYTPTDDDGGKFLRAMASYIDGEGSGTKTAQAQTTQAVGSGTNRAPDFGATIDTREVPEDAAANANVGAAVTASDADNDMLVYSLIGTDAGSFTIDTNTGQITVKATTALDYESPKNNYTVVVQVHDGKNSNGETETNPTIDDTITVTINVTDANDPPEFPGTAAIRAFPENTGPGINIGIQVAATDDDKNDDLTYTLEGTDKDSFEIVLKGGQIKTKEGIPYNHENKDSYSVTVKVNDGNSGTDTIAVTINVTDVNEKPAFTATGPITLSIAENTSANTNIGNRVAATDPDDGDTLFYSLDRDSAEIFDIDTSNGQLKTKADLDKETTAEHTVTVSVRDNRDAGGVGDMENDASISVTITITDVNEPPAFPSTETRTRNVRDDTAAEQDIGNPVAAVDPDVGATLTYTLGGTDVASFGFDPATGQLKTKAALDKETKDTYSVTVSVKDNPSDAIPDATITVTINVTDSNEPPVLSGSAAVSYPENGTGPVSTYTAIDPEGATIDWSLKGTDAAKFTIDGGVLEFKASPDYEDPLNPDHEYSVTVVATDKTNPVEQAVTVTITDENDPPNYDPAMVSRVVNENTQPGGGVGLPVSATDPDTGDTLTYSLGGEDSASLGIDSRTGLITVGTGTMLDFEVRSAYVVTVIATDSSFLSATVTVNIAVIDVDEDGEVTLSQSRPQAGTLLVATLHDPDGDTVSSTTWKWEISDDGSNNWTAITGETTASYTPVSDDVGKFLQVTASYTDGHGPNKTARAAPADAVRAAPVTNVAPELPSRPVSRTIAENTGAGEDVGAAVEATDANNDTLATNWAAQTRNPSP